MSDQVALLPILRPPYRQLGAPGAACGGRSFCTDNVGAEIVRRDRGKTITAAAFRRAARPNDETPCAGLTPSQFLRGLRAFGVKGYEYAARVTVNDVLEATDRGIVLVGVNYGAYPSRIECEIGGKTDFHFTGAHAISAWGRRKIEGRWNAWTRDPDHHYGDADAPSWDRMDMRYLARAINALPGTSGWKTTFAIWRHA
jgi:hypothetical protein